LFLGLIAIKLLNEVLKTKVSIRLDFLAYSKSKKQKKAAFGSFFFIRIFFCYFTSINSTSKINVASGGITPPAPALPYAKSLGITKRALSPTLSN